MSNLSAVPYLPETPSQATPGLWNYPLSVISANLAALNSDVTLNLPSGETFSLYTNLDASGNIHAGRQMGIGATPSAVTTAVMTIAADSSKSDYIHFEDSSAGKSNYGLGSRFGGTADGLNIYDLSGDTMIVSFSKQSIRFYQNVVGPVFDVGGALADTYNAGTFGTGADSVESRIQAAINQASTDGISRVYVPANMYPYSASSTSFIYTVQMVREGGRWDVYDIQAYGADPTGASASSISNRASAQAMLDSAAGRGTAFISTGTYKIRHGLRIPSETELVGEGWRSTLFFDYVNSGGSNYLLNDGYPSSRNSNIRLRSFQMLGGGTGIRTAGTGKPQGIFFFSVHSFHIIDVKASRVAGISVNYQACSDGRILSNFIADVEADGITGFFDNSNIVIANNTLHGLGDDGIALIASASGSTFSGHPQNIAIVGNTIFGQSIFTSPCFGRGIALEAARNVTVSSNVISSTAAQGILCAMDEDNLARRGSNIVIANNIVDSAGSAGPTTDGQGMNGLSITSCDDVLVQGNVFSNCSTNGIAIRSVRNAIIAGNSIVSNGRSIGTNGLRMAIDVGTSISSRVVIVNNIIRGNAAGGINWAHQVDGIIANNLILDNGSLDTGATQFDAGILVATGSLNVVLDISNNYITDNRAAGSKLQSYGIRIPASSGATLRIANNYVSGNSGGGIEHTGTAPLSLYQYGNIGADGSTNDVFGWLTPSGFTVGTALLPGMSFASESSLGWYRSAASTMALSYGTFLLNSFVRHTVTAAPTQVQFLSPSNTFQMGVGRSGTESSWYVINSNGAFITQPSSRAGDSALVGNSNTTLHLGVGSVGVISLTTKGGRQIAVFNQSGVVSIRTLAASSITASAANTNVLANEMVFTVGGASGASLALHSGGTVYIFDSVSSAKAT